LMDPLCFSSVFSPHATMEFQEFSPSAAIFNGDHTALSHLMFWVDMSFRLLVAFCTRIPRILRVNRSEIDSRGEFLEIDREFFRVLPLLVADVSRRSTSEKSHTFHEEQRVDNTKAGDLIRRILPVNRSQIDSLGEFSEFQCKMRREEGTTCRPKTSNERVQCDPRWK
jgi:hypothetical protein